MLLKMTDEPDDYEGPWPREGAMTKPTVESVMRMIHDNEFMRNDDARDKIRADIESLAAPAAPQQAEPVGHFLFDKEWKTWEQMADKYQNDSDAVPLYRHPPAAQAVCDSYAAENQQLSDEVQRLRDAAKAVLVDADLLKMNQWESIKLLRRALEGGE